MVTLLERIRHIVVPPSPPVGATRSTGARSRSDQAIEALPRAAYAFDPGPIQVAERVRSSLLVDPQPVFARSQSEYDQRVAEGFLAGRATRIAETMEAQLTASAGLRITPVDPARQEMSFQTPNQWRWDVEALGPGEHVLSLILYALIPLRGELTRVRVPPFPHEQRVRTLPAAPLPPPTEGPAPGPGVLSADSGRPLPGSPAVRQTSPQRTLTPFAVLAGLVLALAWLIRRWLRRRSRVAPFAPPVAASCFISYSRADSDFAHRLAADLEAQGIHCWVDTDDIPGGAQWLQNIPRAIESHSHCLAIVTPASASSNFVSKEISWAENHRRVIIPILASKHAQLPFALVNYQWVDFTAEYDPALRRLVESIRQTAPPSRASGAAAG